MICDWCVGTGWMGHPDDLTARCTKCGGSGGIANVTQTTTAGNATTEQSRVCRVIRGSANTRTRKTTDMSKFKDWVMDQQGNADAELMVQLEIAQQAIIELQADNDALREALDTIQARARIALQGGTL